MGREATILCIEGAKRWEVKAHLDSAALQLTGGKKLKLPLTQVTSAKVEGEDLAIASKQGAFKLRLGAKEAAAWAKKILNPPTLADKLGIKPGKTVLLIGALPAEVVAAAKAAQTAAKLPKTIPAHIAALMLAPGKEEQLIVAAAKALAPGAALWLVYEKGRAVNGDAIIALARKAGLKDTKVARVSETHAALRFIR